MAMASVTEGEEDVRLIEANWLTSLPRGEGFARIGGSRYKFLVPQIKQVKEKSHVETDD
jgi:hypothetical protein